MNPQPEAGDSDFTQPKITVDAGLDAIKVRLSRSQVPSHYFLSAKYHLLISLLSSFI